MKPSPFLHQTRPTPGDFVGAISVALVLVPQAIAYATIAGLPAQSGLFAATLPLIVAAPFVSCPWLQTGPVALTSLLTFGALQSVAVSNDAELMAAAALLALIVGISRLILGLMRLGSFTKLLSRPVVLGFTTAAAILIISSQLSKTLGTPHDDENNVLWRAIKSVSSFDWSFAAIFVAFGAAAVVHFGRKIHRLFPSILVAVILAIVYSHVANYQGDVVGNLDGSFISFRTTFPWANLTALLVPGIVIAFIGFAEPASISMTLMEEEEMEWNPNRELCGGGFANILSGLVGGYPVGGSFSRTSINKFAGADTPWSGLFTGLLVLSMLSLTPYLAKLPEAALAAIIIMAVVRLIKFKEIIAIWRENRLCGILSVTTLLFTLATAPNVERGILIGVLFGIGVKFWDQQQTMACADDSENGSSSN